MSCPVLPVNRILRLSALVLVVGGILFLALKPTPGLEELHILPLRWARYIDGTDDLRNIAGFFSLAVAIWVLLVGGRKKIPWRQVRIALVFVVLLVPAVEVVQLFLPGRFSDLRDVGTGWLGIALAAAAIAVVRAIRHSPMIRGFFSKGQD
jgi:VanZ family protein